MVRSLSLRWNWRHTVLPHRLFVLRRRAAMGCVVASGMNPIPSPKTLQCMQQKCQPLWLGRSAEILQGVHMQLRRSERQMYVCEACPVGTVQCSRTPEPRALLPGPEHQNYLKRQDAVRHLSHRGKGSEQHHQIFMICVQTCRHLGQCLSAARHLAAHGPHAQKCTSEPCRNPCVRGWSKQMTQSSSSGLVGGGGALATGPPVGPLGCTHRR